MKTIADIFRSENIKVNCLEENSDSIIKTLISLSSPSSPSSLYDCLYKKEKANLPSFGRSLNILHTRCPDLTETVASLVVLQTPIFWREKDKETVKMVFLIAGTDSHDPSRNRNEYMICLAKLCQALSDGNLREQIQKAKSCEEIHLLLTSIP